MAIDNTPPRLKLIATIAVITVVTLISLDFVFKSYYAMMTDEAQHEKVAPTRDRDEQKKAEAAAMAAAAMPVEAAMGQIAHGGRPEAITPQASDDMGPMTGWSKLPKPAPTPIAHTADAPPATTDGGTTTATDAGVGDAGAAHKSGADAGHAPAPAGDAGAHHG